MPNFPFLIESHDSDDVNPTGEMAPAPVIATLIDMHYLLKHV